MDLADSYRILQGIVHDIANSPNGLSTGEIVRTYGISRRLIPKYISILETVGVPIYTDRKRYYLDESYFSPFTLTADEGELLYLALERSLLYHSGHSSTLRSLLLKLGNKMLTPLADYVQAYLDQDAAKRPFDRWFSLLAQAKRSRQEVWVVYHPLNRPYESRWLIRPYRFVSNPLSDGLYIHCEGSKNGDEYIPMSLRLDRIVRVEITGRSFSTQEVAEFTTYAGSGWGVWNSDREPITIRLRFEPRHYDRLLETIWHPTQQIRVEKDDYVIFSVAITEPQEMIPWIRSWGSGVVVLEPSDLRQRMIRSLTRQLEAYGLAAVGTTVQSTSLGNLWAKYDKANGNYHRLECHLLDVAAVALVMWEKVFSRSQRAWIAALLGLDESTAQRVLALLAGLHDIGKATPGFQRKAFPLYEQLLASGIPDELQHDKPHGMLSAIILTKLMEEAGVTRKATIPVALAIGGHHGKWISHNEMQASAGAVGREHWRQIQHNLFDRLNSALGTPGVTLPSTKAEVNTFAVFLSGFVSVCDWIGSDETYFPYETTDIAADAYLERAAAQADTALAENGWYGWKRDSETWTFNTIFPQFAPNSLQQAAIQSLDAGSKPPKLVLVEYLTGGGKTELALYLADHWVNQLDLNGVYVAMPTQATSNQMFERVTRYLETRYRDQPINVQLAHAQSDQHPLYQQLSARPEREGDENRLAAENWFQNRKRSLLAPFAVGTIDQAMLSVLQARHHFVRQYGLSHKVVIFDEIHAYDTYMNEIIDQLIVWLNTLNSPMIMLSATLPKSSRLRLLNRIGGKMDGLPEIPYPRLTVVHHDGSVQVHPLPVPITRTLQLYHIKPDIASLTALLAAVYEGGGCVAVICNTVDEAIAVAHELRESGAFAAEDVLLFHARVPFAWRNQTEQRVLSMFSKTGRRPTRAILVATQIIEQSLDLDFDLIVTSVAPIDLLIQRAGRLHRHDRPNRPAHLSEPILVIRQPSLDSAALPAFGVDEAVYSRYVLLKTWLLIQDKTVLMLPDEIDALMGFVYDLEPRHCTDSLELQVALLKAQEQLQMQSTRSAFRGAQYRIGTPRDESLIGGSSFDLSDDEYTAVTTREIRPNIDIICVRDAANGSGLPLLLDRKPTRDEIALLLRFRVTVSKKELVEALKRLPEYPHWVRIPSLRLARPLIFVNGTYVTPGGEFTLRLTHDYGLEITEA